MHESPRLYLYREADRLGSAQQLIDAHRGGHLVRLARGVYTDIDAWMSLSPDEKHRTRVRAAAAISAPGSQFSHDSAAAMLHLPSIGAWPDEIHELVARSPGGTSRSGIRRHALGLDPAPQIIDGVTVTSLARTVIDMSCTTSFARAVAMADAARQRGLSPETLSETIDSLGPYRRLRRARAVGGFSTALSESPGESFARVQFHALGYPAPELQVAFVDERGFIGYVDFFWRELGLIVEFDGRSKYGALRQYQRSMTLEQILLDEKRREDRLRRASDSFVRLTWAMVADRRQLALLLLPHGLTESGRSPIVTREPVSRE